MTAPKPSDRESLPRRWGPGILLAGAVLAGALIRLDQIADQVPAGDEWHALAVVRDHTYGWIFNHFGVSDHSIPLALYDKALADVMGLTEMSLRAPMLLAGIAALVLIPRLLRHELGRKASVLLAWLLAISPLHVYFSRYARPYSPAFLCAVLSTIAFDRWRRTGRRGWAIVFVACTVLAAWLFPVFLPFLLAPFAGLVLRLIFRRRSALGDAAARPRGSARPLAIATAIGLVAVLGPPILSDFGSIARRSEAGRSFLAPPIDVFELMSGANRPLLTFAFGVAVVLGVVAMRGRWRGVPGRLLFATGCQAAGLLATGPKEIGVPITTARYLLPALALLLLLAAVGLEHLDGLLRKEWKRVPRHAASACIVLCLFVFGPLPSIHYRPNAFTNHAAFQYNYAPSFSRGFATRNLALNGSSPFFPQLGEQAPDGGVIVEAPWRYEWHLQPLPFYQRLHGWPVLVGFVARQGEPLPPGELPSPDPRFRFRTFVHVSDFERLHERGVRYVIFNRDPPRRPWDDPASIAHTIAWIGEYEKRFGPPAFVDDALTVFDLQGNH
jgi:hypothetical protein